MSVRRESGGESILIESTHSITELSRITVLRWIPQSRSAAKARILRKYAQYNVLTVSTKGSAAVYTAFDQLSKRRK